MEAIRSSETSIDIQRTTRHYVAEDINLYNHRRVNLSSYIGKVSPVFYYKFPIIMQLIGSSSPCESNRASPIGGRKPLLFKRDLIGLSLSLSLSMQKDQQTHQNLSRGS
jgi:hypothetical protein